ncbi:MAG: alpha-amylase/4-alpha-glucanotransferase domain-containing protein [Candidatus Omnitrophota bacterium]
MGKTKFAMAFHCYQPVFNFEREIEKAYESAYLPFLRTLDSFPGIKASFHYSGNMLEWLEARHPEYIRSVRGLIERGQIELLGGGCYEPVMVLIPERDRAGQLRMNNEILRALFGVSPRGVWLSERVWESSLADTLSAAGAEYTIVDDHHILRAGHRREKIFKPCRTRGAKSSITLFPSLTRLRYSMPFRRPADTVDYIRETAAGFRDESAGFFFADDIEKFGAWPYTYRRVYKQGWLKDFFSLLEDNSGWLQTAKYSEILDTTEPEDIGEMPESSYAEMMEWSGGNFKNFLEKYPEARRMRERMVSVSDMVENAAGHGSGPGAGQGAREARKELFMAQTGCPYWHGTFGGLYLPHLRSGVYGHLIKAQNIIDRDAQEDVARPKVIERDRGEQSGETEISNGHIVVFINPPRGGMVTELDHKVLKVNLVNTLSRVKEEYHKKLDRNYSSRIRRARKAIMNGGPADVHDALGVGERGLRKMLVYDDHARGCFLTHIFGDRFSWEEVRKGKAGCDSFLKEEYVPHLKKNDGVVTLGLSRRDEAFIDDGRLADLEVTKKVVVCGGPSVRFEHKVRAYTGGPDGFKYGVEFNFLIWDKAAMAKPRLLRTDRFSLEDMYSGMVVGFKMDRTMEVYSYPVFTINETEAGLKKMFQGVAIYIGGECGYGEDEEVAITLEMGSGGGRLDHV